MDNKKLVLGAAGFIGSQLTKSLINDGFEVIGIDSFDETLYPSRRRRESVRELQNKGLEFIETDANFAEWGSILQGVDVVYNLAAVPGLTPSWGNFGSYNSSNLMLVNSLLQGLLDFPSIFLVHASTSSVYGREATSSSLENPNSPYGVTKLAAENLIKSYSSASGLKFSILRYFSVYGPHPRPDQFFAILLDRLTSGQEIEIFGDGLNSRTNTYLDDVVEATTLAGAARSDGLIVDISGAESATTLEIVNLVSSEIGVLPTLVHSPDRLGDQRLTAGTGDLARSELGWVPKTPLASGVREMVRRYRKAV